MRKLDMLIFLLIVLSIYGLANFYILKRGGQALRGHPVFKLWFFVIMGFLILSYPLGRILMAAGRGIVTDSLVRIGSLYLALMLHLFLLAVVVDLFRAANAILRFFPKAVTADPAGAAFVVFIACLGISAGLLVGGYVNALHPRLRTLDIRIEKTAGSGLTRLKAVMASDIHLGTIMESRRLQAIVGRINALNPDVVLLPGDIVDESVSAAEEEKMISALKAIRAPLGVFSVPGNHEVYGGLEKNLGYLRKGGIRVLEDEALVLGGAFVLAGRKDPAELRHREARKPIGAILAEAGVDRRLPVILLDHEPLRLAEARDAGVDLQLSGHTHAGQLFPLNLINKKIWEQYWGYLRKGTTQYYVSCGVGTWGPAVRTGSVPEIVEIRIEFGPPV
jgi:uncharacterized protein